MTRAKLPVPEKVRERHPPVRYHGIDYEWSVRPLEKDVQNLVKTLLKILGFTVASTSQYRQSRVEVGLPDLFITHPQLIGCGGFEVKRPGERLSEKQQKVACDFIRCHAPYCWGTDEDLHWWAVSLGWARFEGKTWMPINRYQCATRGFVNPLRYIVPDLQGPTPWPESAKTRILQLHLPLGELEMFDPTRRQA